MSVNEITKLLSVEVTLIQGQDNKPSLDLKIKIKIEDESVSEQAALSMAPRLLKKASRQLQTLIDEALQSKESEEEPE